MRVPQAKLQSLLDRFNEVEARMGAAQDGAAPMRASTSLKRSSSDWSLAWGTRMASAS